MSEVKKRIENLKKRLRKLPEDTFCGYEVLIHQYLNEFPENYADADLKALENLEDSLKKFEDDGCPALSYDVVLKNTGLEVVRTTVLNLTTDITLERTIPGTADEDLCDILIRVDDMPAGYGGILLCFVWNDFQNILYFYTDEDTLGVDLEDARIFGVGDLIEMLRISKKLNANGYTVLFYEAGE